LGHEKHRSGNRASDAAAGCVVIRKSLYAVVYQCVQGSRNR
jgi:hypothetical protein